MNIPLLFFLMALVTFIPRALPAALAAKMKFGCKTRKFLELIPYTAMAALIFPGILTVDPDRLYIGIVGGLVALLLALIKKIPVALVVLGAVGAVLLMYTFI
jgi:branched-subunit amino acid transport protein